jgi:hypothetical protein
MKCLWSRGRLNTEGCHNQNSGGTYHPHRGPVAGQSFANRALLLIRPLWIVSPQVQLMVIVIGVLFLQLTRLLNPVFV